MKPHRGRQQEPHEDMERRRRRDDEDETTRDTGGMSAPGRTGQPRGTRSGRSEGSTRTRKKK